MSFFPASGAVLCVFFSALTCAQMFKQSNVRTHADIFKTVTGRRKAPPFRMPGFSFDSPGNTSLRYGFNYGAKRILQPSAETWLHIQVQLQIYIYIYILDMCVSVCSFFCVWVCGCGVLCLFGRCVISWFFSAVWLPRSGGFWRPTAWAAGSRPRLPRPRRGGRKWTEKICGCGWSERMGRK